MDIKDFLERHEKVAFQFGGGKDSVACLKLLEPYLDKITVLWANAGNPYPETIEQMVEVCKRVPYFVMVCGEQPEWTKFHGMPVDVMPVRAGHFGPTMGVKDIPLLQPFNQCCSHNLWEPMANWILNNKVTGLIRGEKYKDSLHTPFKSGDIVDGIELFYPIAEWTNADVYEFLGDDIPNSYKRGLESSLDCMDCTAYVSENRKRIKDLDLIYPPAAKKIREVHSFLKAEMLVHLKDLEA